MVDQPSAMDPLIDERDETGRPMLEDCMDNKTAFEVEVIGL